MKQVLPMLIFVAVMLTLTQLSTAIGQVTKKVAMVFQTPSLPLALKYSNGK